MRILGAAGVLVGVTALGVQYEIVDGNDHVVAALQLFDSVKSFDEVDQGHMLADKQVNCVESK